MKNSQPRWFTSAALVVASGAIAVDAIAGPAVASADPVNPKPRTEQDIKQDCESGVGGVYGTTVEGGNRKSTCLYIDDHGNEWIDNYKNGKFTGTQGPFRPKTTPSPPPPGATAILPPGSNTRADIQ